MTALLALGLCFSGPGGDWPMFGGRPDRNMVSAEKGLPAKWDKDPKKSAK